LAKRQRLYDELLPLLDRPVVNPVTQKAMSFCPVHGDGKKSGRRSLSLTADIGLKCFAGCTEDREGFHAVINALYAAAGQERPAYDGPAYIREAEDDNDIDLDDPDVIYEYRNADGVLVAEKSRYEYFTPDGNRRKTFRWRTPGQEKFGRLEGMKEHQLPLWGSEMLAERPSDWVFFTEGEKACQACRAQGLLAVCAAGGSSQKDFGTALEVLRNRKVYLWPDNDAPGQKYLATLRGALANVAAELRVVSVPVDPGGDAYDFFREGGAADAITSGVYETQVQVLAQDHVRILVPTDAGLVSLDFDELEKSGREFNSVLTVEVGGPLSQAPYRQRLNMLSSSSVTDLRRTLQEVYGKEPYAWVRTLATALDLAQTAYLDQDLAEAASDIVGGRGEQFHVDTFVPAGEMSVIFGQGSGSKTYVSLLMGLAVCYGADFVGFKALPGNVLFVDYEANAGSFRRRLDRICQGLDVPVPGNFFYFPARGIPFKDQIDSIRRVVEQKGITFVIVDSAAAACGGEPEKTSNALGYFASVAKLDGVTCLTIAHIAKADWKEERTDMPFGSAFWHNQPRRTWYVKREQEVASSISHVGLYCRKVNDGPLPAPVGLELNFNDPGGPVVARQIDIQENPDLDAERTLRQRMKDLLAGGPMKGEAIAEALGARLQTVSRHLTRYPEFRGSRDKAGKLTGVWSLRHSQLDDDEEEESEGAWWND
jgi:hypothetical protein